MSALPAHVARLFPGPVKSSILRELAAAAPGHMTAADLCERVFGSTETDRRNTLKSLIVQMRPKLAKHGFAIRGRKDLRLNGYLLVNEMMED